MTVKQHRHAWEGVVIDADIDVAPKRVIINDYTDIQRIVGGFATCLSRTMPGTRAGDLELGYWCNEDGLLMDVKQNMIISMMLGEPIVGNVVISGGVDSAGQTADVPTALVEAFEHAYDRLIGRTLN